jgi:hypothetical protein
MTIDYTKMRKKYQPQNIIDLFILESPPKSGKYFYDEDGLASEPLFKAMMELININPRTKAEGLEAFKNKGCILVDATYTPVNGMNNKGDRNKIISDDYNRLKADLDELVNAKTNIYLIKVNVFELLNSRLIFDKYPIKNNNIKVPFPSTGQQGKFRKAMKEIYINR